MACTPKPIRRQRKRIARAWKGRVISGWVYTGHRGSTVMWKWVSE